jgi:hypothetical protein
LPAAGGPDKASARISGQIAIGSKLFIERKHTVLAPHATSHVPRKAAALVGVQAAVAISIKASFGHRSSRAHAAPPVGAPIAVALNPPGSGVSPATVVPARLEARL